MHAAGPTSVGDAPASYLRLWGHEATRVFHDRLTTEADRAWFTSALADQVSELGSGCRGYRYGEKGERASVEGWGGCLS